MQAWLAYVIKSPGQGVSVAARAWNRAVTPSVKFWLFRDAGASASELAPSVMFCSALAGRAVDAGAPALE